MKFSHIVLFFVVFWVGCSPIKVDKDPDTGFYVVNEGSFGHTTGSVNYVDQDSMRVDEGVISELGNTTCYGAKWEGVYYFVSKQGRRLVSYDEKMILQRESIDNLGGDGRAFVGIDKVHGAVSTSNGVFRLILQPLSVGAVIESTKDVQCGGMYSAGGYLYVINQERGLQIFDIAKDYALAKEYAGVGVGFAKAKDGSLWAAGEDFLIRINLNNLMIDSFALPSDVKIYNSWGGWNAGSLCAGIGRNVLFFAKADSEWGGGRQVYSYDIASNKVSIFATSLDEQDTFYGSSIGVDPHTGMIVAMMTKGYDFNDNRLVFFDSVTGGELKRITYSGYWFPAMLLFNR